MGRGIALAFAQTGRTVILIDPSADALASAKKHIARLVERSRSRQKLTDAQAEELLGRFTYASDKYSLAPSTSVKASRRCSVCVALI
jgi:3-hydroxybutyryl-CoA dehydrogenase